MKHNLSTLYIATDSDNTNWLEYILEEFARFNLVEFEIQFCSIDHHAKDANVIYYTKDHFPGVCLPNRSHIQPCGEMKWITQKLFVIERSYTTDKRFECQYDIFWNAFVFLSRLEEFQFASNNYNNTTSYRNAHPRIDKTTFDIPIVNYLFDELETIIKRCFPQLVFGPNRKPTLELSHDVDYIEKTIQLRIKQTAFNSFNTLKTIRCPKYSSRLALKTISFLISNPSYWCFDYWENLEKQNEKRSVFYVYVQTNRKNFKSWLIDPSYNVASNKALQRKLKQLTKDNFEVGLHGSYLSAVRESQLIREKELLEDIIEHEVGKVRQHWLRYEEAITPVLHDKYFRYDSSLGWNDHMGFRSGCVSQYRPYDHKRQKPFNYFAIPLVIMDSQIFDYGADRSDSLAEKALILLSSLKNFKSSHVSVSWHQRVQSKDYRWHEIFEKILGSTHEYL